MNDKFNVAMTHVIGIIEIHGGFFYYMVIVPTNLPYLPIIDIKTEIL